LAIATVLEKKAANDAINVHRRRRDIERAIPTGNAEERPQEADPLMRDKYVRMDYRVNTNRCHCLESSDSCQTTVLDPA